MKFIKLTQIQRDPHSVCTLNDSEIVGKILIPQKTLENSIIVETKELAPPIGFYVQNQIDYERSTTKILINCSEFELTSISVAESYQSILDKLDESKD